MENSGCDYNSRVLHTFILYLKYRMPEVNRNIILRESKISMADIENENKWFTHQQIISFYNAVKKVTVKDIAYEAGKFAASPYALPTLKKILNLKHPKNVFDNFDIIAGGLLSKSTTYKTEVLSSEKFKITVKYLKNEKPFQCDNRRGFLEAIPKIFGYNAKVTHGKKDCCYHNKSNKCIYHVTIEKPELNDDYRELVKTIDYKYRSIRLMKMISGELGKCIHEKDILQKSVNFLHEHLDFNRYIIWLANPIKKKLIYQIDKGCTDIEKKILHKNPFNIKQNDDVGPLIKCYNENRPELINDIKYVWDSMSEKSKEFVKPMKVKSFICCPISFDDIIYGVLEADNRDADLDNNEQKDKRSPYTQDDVDLLMSVSLQIGTALHYRNIANDNYNKSRENHSTLNFNKSYNTLIKNICHRLRRILYFEQPYSKILTLTIEDFIDLWANEHSALTNVPKMTNQFFNNKQWIEGFAWNDFQKDLENFMYHLFFLCINDLYDHYDVNKIPSNLLPMSKIWAPLNPGKDQAIGWKSFINFSFKENQNDIIIFGIRPLFRVILVNMLQNAIEAIDFFSVAKKSINHRHVDLPKISFGISQDKDSTIITVFSQGFCMPEKLINNYKRIFSNINKDPLKASNELNYDELVDKKQYTTKSATGSGIALIEAALYFSKIIHLKNDTIINRGEIEVESEKSDMNTGYTKFFIKLPFGSRMTKKYFERTHQFQKEEERIAFQWSLFNNLIPDYISDQNDDITGIPNQNLSFVKINDIHADSPNQNQLSFLKKNDISEQRIEVLVIEDSRPDRYRFRDILSERSYRFAFTWDASKKQMLNACSVMVMINQWQPKTIILDLAWTIQDEKRLERLRFMDFDEIINEEESFSHIHSFKLLNAITKKYAKNNKIINPQVIIVTQYIFPMTYGIREYIERKYIQKANMQISIINKWRDEKMLRALL